MALRDCGDIILVKGFLTKDNVGRIVYDERSVNKGRPCVIISDLDYRYHVCPIIDTETFSVEDIFFKLNEHMVYLNGNGSLHKRDAINMSKFISLSIYENFDCIGKLTPKNYLRLLQRITSLYDNSNIPTITDTKLDVLEDVKLQLHR